MKQLLASLLFVLACGGDSSPIDASTDAHDGGTDVEVRDARPGDLDGPGLVFVGEEACYRTGLADDMARFTWGDGTRDDVVSNMGCHVWSFPGTFLVSVQAGGSDASRVVRVVPRPAEVAPVSSSPLLVHDSRAWIASADADRVVVVDLDGLDREAILPACDRPRTLGISAGVVAAACEDGVLARYDAETLERLADVALGAGTIPFGVVGSADAFFVTLRGSGELVRVRGEDLERLQVGFDARAITLNGAGVALVTHWRSDVEGARVTRVDADAMRVVETILLPREEGLDSDTNNSGVPSFLDAIAFTPDGERALVPSLKANVVAGTFRSSRELTSQTTARAILSELLPDDGAYVESFRFAFDDLDYASALVATPVGDRVYVAILGSQRVIALEPFNFDVVGSIADVGIAPRGLALDASGRLLVYADLSRELRVYDVSDLSSEPPLLATISTVDTEPLAPDVLAGKRIFHTAVDPRMSRTSYLSCATCHLDGEGDNLVWDFTQRGEGLRNTVDLSGRAGISQGPVHWTGNFDEIQDFEADIRLHQGGIGFLSEADWLAAGPSLGAPKAGLSPELDALAAYVGSLNDVGISPLRRSDAAFDAERAMGEAVFAGAGCPTCHAPPSYTDSAIDRRHDVGTFGAGTGQRLGAPLDGLDTPTLRGLWRNAPYLHDGSATLRDVLTIRNAGDLHGTTSDLSDAELDALELFLLTLDDA